MNRLINQIAKDLRIYRYENELTEEYGNRLIYSALAAWGRVQILGCSYADLNEIAMDYPLTSKRYINERLKSVSDGLINTIPNKIEWLEGRKKEEAINIGISKFITEELIFCYQLNKTKRTGWLTALPKRRVKFKNYELLLGGTDWNSNIKNACAVGLGIWRKSENNDFNYKEVFNIPDCNLEEYYKSIERNASWKPDKLNCEYEYFTGGYGLWHNNKAWRIFNSNYIPSGISIIRKSNDKHNYSLLYYRNNEIFTAKLDKWYMEENEINRIMFALDYINGKPAEFKAKKNGTNIELHCHSRLPNAENRILLMASWPNRTYDDFYLRNIPDFLWEDVEMVLKGLGINIVFE